MYGANPTMKETLRLEDATALVNEQAFERIDQNAISFCLTQIIK